MPKPESKGRPAQPAEWFGGRQPGETMWKINLTVTHKLDPSLMAVLTRCQQQAPPADNSVLQSILQKLEKLQEQGELMALTFEQLNQKLDNVDAATTAFGPVLDGVHTLAVAIKEDLRILREQGGSMTAEQEAVIAGRVDSIDAAVTGLKARAEQTAHDLSTVEEPPPLPPPPPPEPTVEPVEE